MLPRHMTVCCQGMNARRNGVARKTSSSSRETSFTPDGVAARPRADFDFGAS